VGSRRDGKLILFGVLNIVQAALVGAIPLVAPARSGALNWALGAAAVLMLAAAPALVFGGRIGRRIAMAICLAHWVLGLAFAALIVAAASYLYGLYGHSGQTAGAIAFVLAALVLVLFWLIPGHEIHYLTRRAEKP
jgi:small-conductance mechanosensitive channel